jgi:iron complex transport system substrate-binding protein
MPEPAAPSRIVSLLPAATEIVACLGLRANLVGRSHECDEPADVAALPALTATRIDASASSRGIHEQVGRAFAEQVGREAAAAGPAASAASCGSGAGASLYTLDVDRLAALAPDLVLTQAACDVCAVSTADVAAAVARLGGHTRVLSLQPRSLADLLDDVVAVGAATGRLPQARELAARLQARIDSVACRSRALARRDGTAPPRVALIEWLDPPMAAGNWMPGMVRLAGGIDVFECNGGPSHWITWDDVAAADPDVVVLVPCGFTLDRVVDEAATSPVRPHLERLRAFRDGRCVAVDGHHLFNRPGPRLVDSLEALAHILHPGSFAFPAARAHVARLPG